MALAVYQQACCLQDMHDCLRSLAGLRGFGEAALWDQPISAGTALAWKSGPRACPRCGRRQEKLRHSITFTMVCSRFNMYSQSMPGVLGQIQGCKPPGPPEGCTVFVTTKMLLELHALEVVPEDLRPLAQIGRLHPPKCFRGQLGGGEGGEGGEGEFGGRPS